MARLPILLLGSTGSIGTQALDLVRAHPDRYDVVGLSAYRSWEALLDQVNEWRVPFVALEDPDAAAALAERLPPGCTLFQGPEANQELVAATRFEVALHGIVGATGLEASVGVLQKGKRLALANKESLVLAGQPLLELARRHGGEIVPVDSEHSAIHQCLRGESVERIRKVWLTASGGPFRGADPAQLEAVTPAMALRHPTWEMGPRITVGSATLMNKALEIIELHHLFDLPAESIGVAVHPQSIVHSMVEFVDGSVIAQMGPPDMRLPIHFALHAPDRAPAPQLRGFDFESFSQLTFEAPDPETFPALGLGFDCVRAGGTSGAVLNAADEVAVQAFLDEILPFQAMADLWKAALEARPQESEDVAGALRADRWARTFTQARIGERFPSPA